MKRLITLFAAIVLPIAVFAQAQITTKKMKIADFPDKTTKIVLTGKQLFDASYQKEVKKCWNVSMFEFCTLQEFEALKNNPDYYFLMIVSGQFKKETAPGIEMLTLVKGGVGSEEGIDGLFEVISVPFRPIGDDSGRELYTLPVFLNVIQNYTLDAIENDITGYTGLDNYTLNLGKSKEMRLVYAEKDLANDVNATVRNMYMNDNGTEVMEDADDADELIDDKAEKTLVSYVVAPLNPIAGSLCYKMLINTETYELYFFKKHKITKKYGAGFLTEDVKKIASYR